MNPNIINCKVCAKPIIGGKKVFEQHCAGKKHAHLLPNKITVKGSFDIVNINEVTKYFEKFGDIINFNFKQEEDYVLVNYVFKTKTSYTDIIHQNHELFGKPLEIIWSKPESQSPLLPCPPQTLNAPATKFKKFPNIVKNSRKPVRLVSNIVNINKNTATSSTVEAPSGSSEGQVQPSVPPQNKKQSMLQQKQKMAQANPEVTKESIINDIKNVKTFFEQIKILQNKLQGNQQEVLKNYKLIHMDISSALAPVFNSCKIHFFGSSVTGLNFQGSDLDVYISNVKQRYKRPEVPTLKIIKSLLFKSKKFCDILLISGATVPIIKCIHTKTQICCDINIRNKLSVCNTQLINYYLNLDEKIRPLTIIIKFWADYCGLKKVNFFSGYALYMMIIFYLQQEPYKVPTVFELQKSWPSDFEDGWNCAFAPIREYSNSNLKNTTILDLLIGFFKFYSNFDYFDLVICPYLGIPLKRINFINPCDLPDCFENYVKKASQSEQQLNVNSSFCIQDPFEHCKNVSSAIKAHCAGRFPTLCKVAQEVASSGETNLLHNILVQCLGYDLSVASFEIENLQCDHDVESETKWMDTVKNLILKTLKDVLSCQVNVISTLTGVTSADTSIKYSCEASHNVWENRMNIMKNLLLQLPPVTSEMEKEIATSTCIIKYFPQPLTCKFVIDLNFKKNPCRVALTSRYSSKTKHFLQLIHYLRVKLPEWLKVMKTETSLGINAVENQNKAKESSEIIKEENLKDNSDPVSSKDNEDNEMIAQGDKTNNENVSVDSSLNKDVDNTPDSQQHETTPKPSENCKSSDLVNADDNKTENHENSENQTNGIEQKFKPEEEGELVDDDEEEDVPPDFFDDFSNQDFMDGLDIVDAWDDESGKPTEEETPSHSTEEHKSEKNEKKTHSPIRFDAHRKTPEKRSKRLVDKYGHSRSPIRRRRRSGSYGRRPRTRTRSRSKSRDKIRSFDMRRDPEKTKRDINKDKIKCAKDKEQKIVTDKLKLVETGLVPPGTEMDFDITSLPSFKERHQSSAGSSEKLRDAKVERERKYSRRSSSREMKKLPRHSRSPPVYRSRNRERVDPSYRPRRRTSSVDSNASERELWIRSGRKRSRSRESPSTRSKMRKYEEKKKKSFLEEIREKLNEVRPAPVPVVQYSHPPMNAGFANPVQPHQIPAPVPAPNQFFPQNNPGMQQYDQSFFIGDGYHQIGQSNVVLGQPQNVNFSNMLPNQGNVVSVPQVQMNQVPQIPIQTTKLPVPVPVVQKNASISPQTSVQNETAAKPTEQKDKQTTDDIDKLFADKKISLSDFLTITAKCEVQSSSPEHLQKKIKVISRCQDAIKAMSDDRKFTGRLLVKPTSEPKNKSEVKYQSPLRRIPIVRFQFTSPAKVSEEVDSFAAALDKILQKIGILKETINLDDTSESSFGKVGTGSTFADEDTAALTLKASILGAPKKTITETVYCEECKKRKLRVFSDVGSQCVEDKESISIGIQVNEEDLTPVKGLLKNESIAYLTPAQLLCKEKEKEKDKEKENPSESLAVSNETTEKKKVESPEATMETKKEKPKINFKSRGGFRKSLRDRIYSNFEIDEFEYFDRGRPEYEAPRENFGPRFGTAMPTHRFPARHYVDSAPPSLLRMNNQLREDDGSLFTDFNQPYRGRNPNIRFGPRY